MKKIFSFLVMLFIAGLMISKAQSEKNLPPPPPPPKEPSKVDIRKFKPPVLRESAKQNNAFLKRNPTVATIWQEENTTIIKLKSGKKEKYNLKNETEKKSFVEKYGDPPINPPKIVRIKKFKPPPPPPPKVENNELKKSS